MEGWPLCCGETRRALLCRFDFPQPLPLPLPQLLAVRGGHLSERGALQGALSPSCPREGATHMGQGTASFPRCPFLLERRELSAAGPGSQGC